MKPRAPVGRGQALSSGARMAPVEGQKAQQRLFRATALGPTVADFSKRWAMPRAVVTTEQRGRIGRALCCLVRGG